MELFDVIEKRKYKVKTSKDLLDIIYNKKDIYKYYATKYVTDLNDREQKLLHKRILGEGKTPYVKSKINKNLYYKLESLNPTGSFKDRETSFLFKILKEFDLLDYFEEFAVCSSGNAAISSVLYGNYFRKKVTVFLSRGVSEYKIGVLKKLGADIRIIGEDYEETYRYLIDYFFKNRDKKILNITTGFIDWKDEANKLISYELYKQLYKKEIDYIFVPVGNGSLLFGIWKGFKELLKKGVIKRMPYIYGIQVVNGSPFKKYEEKGEFILNKDEIKDSKADGILARESYNFFKIKYLMDNGEKIKFLYIDEIDINKGFKTFLKEGMLVEYTSAVVMGAYLKYARSLKLLDKIGVLVITGCGLKLL